MGAASRVGSARPAVRWSAVPERPCPSSEFLPNHTTELAGLRRRQIALFGLRVRVHHVERLVSGCPVVDDPESAALARSWRGPPDLAQPARPLDDWPLLWPQHQCDLQLAVPLVVEMSLDGGREHRWLDEPHRPGLYAIGVAPFNLVVRR